MTDFHYIHTPVSTFAIHECLQAKLSAATELVVMLTSIVKHVTQNYYNTMIMQLDDQFLLTLTTINKITHFA